MKVDTEMVMIMLININLLCVVAYRDLRKFTSTLNIFFLELILFWDYVQLLKHLVFEYLIICRKRRTVRKTHTSPLF